MTLHQELTDIILRIAKAHHLDPTYEDNASEAAGAVIEKIISVLPKKHIIKENNDWCYLHNDWVHKCNCESAPYQKLAIKEWNSYHDTLKDILTEELKG